MYFNELLLRTLGMIPAQSLIGIPGINPNAMAMTRTVTSPSTGHPLSVNSLGKF